VSETELTAAYERLAAAQAAWEEAHRRAVEAVRRESEAEAELEVARAAVEQLEAARRAEE
jgi:hypothetical protein